MKVQLLITADIEVDEGETVEEIKEQVTNELHDINVAVEKMSDYLVNVDCELCIESEGHYDHTTDEGD